jgi:hypothetical protein
VKKDLAQAAKWYALAAKAGFASAERNLALCYYEGEGVKRDLPQAIRWMRLARDHGHAKAKKDLAVLMAEKG